MKDKLIWTTEQRRVGELQPLNNNPRRISRKDKEELKKDMFDLGIFRPFILDYDSNIILGGNMKYQILKEEGYDEPINVSIPSRKLTEKEKKKIIILDNVHRGEFDPELLIEEYEDILKDLALDDLIPQIVEEVKEDGYKEPDKLVINVEKGDLWQLGKHRLFCGDSTNPDHVKKLVGEETIKIIVTSPPYNMGANLYKEYKDNLKSQEYIQFCLDVVTLWKTYLKGFLFWNVSYNKNTRWEFIEVMYRMIKEVGLHFMEMIVWDKGHGMPITSQNMLTRPYEDILLLYTEDEVTRDFDLMTISTTDQKAYFNKKKQKGITNYWKIDTSNTQIKGLHGACYPIKLPAKAISLMSEKEEIIADPFGGSGSTLIAAEQLDRKCYTMELDPHYCQVIIDRWEKLTGQKAKRDGGE